MSMDSGSRNYITFDSRVLHVCITCSVDTELTRKFGKRIKAAGGKYSAARGHASQRDVKIPHTRANRALINEIIEKFGRTFGLKHHKKNRAEVSLHPLAGKTIWVIVDKDHANALGAVVREWTRELRSSFLGRTGFSDRKPKNARAKYADKAANEVLAIRSSITRPLLDVLQKLDNAHALILMDAAEALLAQQSKS